MSGLRWVSQINIIAVLWYTLVQLGIATGDKMTDLNHFQTETRSWLADNCPEGARGSGQIANGSTKIELEPDVKLWLTRMADKGWTAPKWPVEFGGGGLSDGEAIVLAEEMQSIKARSPLQGMGLSMIGPTLLEFGTQEQKEQHLPAIIRGELQWCQGYSEPSAGSDLAALRTRAEDKGDYYLINGQKTWTSGAYTADWMFCLVRTEPQAPKHEGISFVLFPMDQSGVTVNPINLISGNSPFCETFLEDVKADKSNLVGELNKGWTVGKRLLQYERSGIGGLASGGGQRRGPVGGQLVAAAKKYLGDNGGRVADEDQRAALLKHNMHSAAFKLTVQRTIAENSSGTPGATTSIFKYVGAQLQQDAANLRRTFMGSRGLAWQEEGFEAEHEATREWLSTKATTIYGGTNEIQLNIIAKRVLGLPE